MKHKHSKEIHAWADGAVIEQYDFQYPITGWNLDLEPKWLDHLQYRVKPTYPITLNSYKEACDFFTNPSNNFITLEKY